MSLKLPFGLKNGELVDIMSVERGLNCGCVCPACKAILVARKNPSGKKVFHFSHYRTVECEKVLETTFHIAAKKIIQEKKYLKLPQVLFYIGNTKKWMILFSEVKTLICDNVKLEQRLEDIVPDIIVESCGITYMIEIAVTHPIDEIKKAKIDRLGISTIEIDLSHSKEITSFKDLENEIIDKVSNKKWIYNINEVSFKRRIENLSDELLVEKNQLNGNEVVGLCPIVPTDFLSKKVSINQCSKCDYLFKIFRSSLGADSYIKCWGNKRDEGFLILSQFVSIDNLNWNQLSLGLEFPKEIVPKRSFIDRNFH